MRQIERTTAFRRDYRRLSRSVQGLDALLVPVLNDLAADTPLPPARRDHALTGNWNGWRDCHIRPDLVLIYQKVGDDLLRLARLGSHADLF